MAPARRPVSTHLTVAERGCLYCLSTEGPFDSREHVLPARFGPDADRFVLERGIVCDPCNHFLGKQVDAPFTDRFDVTLTRGIEGLRDRRGREVAPIEARDATARLDARIDDHATVRIFASHIEETPDGGLDIEIDPVKRDPDDIVARTVRALWKIALGVLYGGQGAAVALDPRWDHLRQAVLGAPFRAYLLEQPFRLLVTRRLDIRLETRIAKHPAAIRFALGGVELAAPIDDGASITLADAQDHGWIVRTTDQRPQHLVRLRLDPSDPHTDPQSPDSA